MIKIYKKDTSRPFIYCSVSDFISVIAYCEHQTEFYLKGIKPTLNVNTTIGNNAHLQQQVYEKKHHKIIPITRQELQDVKQPIEFPRESLYTKFQYTLDMQQLWPTINLAGRSDKIYRDGNSLIILDDKFPNDPLKYITMSQPYPSHLLQLLVYLNSKFSNTFRSKNHFEIPHISKKWIIQIRDRNDQSKIHKIFYGKQDSQTKLYLLQNIQRFAGLVLGVYTPQHHNSVNKCSSCGFADMCELRITQA